jgi:hypothetical protein
VIDNDSGGANGSRVVWCAWRRSAARWCGGAAALVPEDPTDGGGAHGGDPQSGCGDDGADGGAEKPVTPDP